MFGAPKGILFLIVALYLLLLVQYDFSLTTRAILLIIIINNCYKIVIKNQMKHQSIRAKKKVYIHLGAKRAQTGKHLFRIPFCV